MKIIVQTTTGISGKQVTLNIAELIILAQQAAVLLEYDDIETLRIVRNVKSGVGTKTMNGSEYLKASQNLAQLVKKITIDAPTLDDAYEDLFIPEPEHIEDERLHDEEDTQQPGKISLEA